MNSISLVHVHHTSFSSTYKIVSWSVICLAVCPGSKTIQILDYSPDHSSGMLSAAYVALDFLVGKTQILERGGRDVDALDSFDHNSWLMRSVTLMKPSASMARSSPVCRS